MKGKASNCKPPIVLPQHQQQHELNFYTDISPDKNASSSASSHIILFLMHKMSGLGRE